jgi:uncharacterized membrane protein YedE/YeeE
MLNGGLLLGALCGFLLSREFKLVFPRNWRQYVQIILGGIMMGYGAGLASGCSVGAFFSAIPSLGANGFLFGASMALGAFAGVKVVNRLG